MASTSTSTYLLDTNKKCKISGGSSGFKDTTTGIYWSWYGDLETKCLQNLGASFTENWKSGTKHTEESIEKALKPVSTAMNAVVKQIPMMKNVDFGGVDNLRNTAIFLYAIWNAYTGSARSHGGAETKTLPNGMTVKVPAGSGDNASKNLLDQFTYGYRYNIPYRADMPTLEPLGGSKIIINFAYGKCNMFSAKKEVWEPLQHLKAAIFPTVVADESKPGLIKMGANTVPAPYPQQIGVEAINKIISKVINAGKATAYSAYDAIEIFSNAATNLQKLGEGSLKVEKLELKEGFLGFGSTVDYFKYKRDYQTKLQKAANKVYPGASKAISEQVMSTSEEPKAGEEYDFNPQAEAMMKAVNDQLQVDAAVQEDKEIKYPKKDFPLRAVLDKGESAITEAHKPKLEKAAGKGKHSLPQVLKDLINFVPDTVGEVTADLYTSLKNYTNVLEFGYPSVRKTNITDLGGILNNLTARVQLSNILFQKVNISFDFDHVDEYGYPMAGKLEIEKIWNLTYPAEVLSLNGGNLPELNTPVLQY